jgi:excinuclease ABC subunit B
MKFQLRTTFSPTGDQPAAIEKISAGLQQGKKFQTLLGVTGSGKTFTMANVIAHYQKPTLVLVHNKTLAAQLASEYREFFPNNAVEYFVSYYDYYQPESYVPQRDLYIAKEADINEEIERLRHRATMSLLTRRDVIIVASVSCIYGLGRPETYAAKGLVLNQNEPLDRQSVLERLVSINYTRNDIDFHRGTFRARGDIIDVFPSYSEDSFVRLDFFGNNLEKIQEINSLTQKPNATLKKIAIYPNSHYTLAEDLNIRQITAEIKAELKEQMAVLKKANKIVAAERLEQRTRYDMEMLEQTGFVGGVENYSRYLDNRRPGEPPSVLLDYFPKDFLMIVDESHMAIPQVRGMYAGDRSRKDTLIEFGFRLPSARDNRPLQFNEFEGKYNQVIFTSATPGDYELAKCRRQVVEQIIRPTGLLDPEVEIKPTNGQIDDLLAQIQKRIAAKQRVLVTTLTKRMAEDLSKYLAELGIKVQYLHSDVDTMERLEILRDLRTGVFDVLVGINLLREGLDLPEVSLVAILDADKEGYLRSQSALIQVMGRAARHQDGHVIMYADKITRSMRLALNETKRRRVKQMAYNKKHHLTPRSISKAIRDDRLSGRKSAKKIEEFSVRDIPRDEIKRLQRDLKQRMALAARNLEFEKAAAYRDQIAALSKKSRL